ncbi:MAG: cysteine desulfurase NifS [Firmicutes bacterium]|nr:cysteine desulfurase NifS [Bacillota bacterium]
MRRVYLDHSATTPVHPEVIKAMTKSMSSNWGNPSSIHAFGREARRDVEKARSQVADLVGAKPEEIYFTSGGTEADNLALIGIAMANGQKKRHIITSAIEHHAVLHTCEFLEKNGFKVTYLPVDEFGRVRLADVEEALTEETLLISVMHANNEVGTIQPIAEISRLARAKGVYVHTDAVQTLGKIPVNVNDLGVDLMSLSGHKIYGPKGIGCLYIKKGTRIHPTTFGGGQENKRRAGTENVPGIVGFGQAAELAGQSLESEAARLKSLRDRLEQGIFSTIPHVKLNGHPTERLPGHLNVSIEYVEGESLLLSLDLKGIAASSGSACTSGSLEPSHVLMAMGLSPATAHGSLRLTLGRENTEEDIDYVLRELPPIVERLREMSSLYVGQKGAAKHV